MVDLTKYGAVEVADPNTANIASGSSAMLKKFATSVAREDYQNPLVPDVVEATEEEKLKELEALHNAMPEAYDSDTVFGEGVAENIGIVDIARSKSLEDKQAKFKKYFPSSQLRMESINGKNYLLGRKSEGDKWKRIDSFSGDLAAGTASAATIGAVAGEVAGGLALPIVGAPLGAFGGYLAGSAIDKALEKGRGYSKDESFAPSAEDYFVAGTGGVLSFGGKLFEKTFKKGAKAIAGLEDSPQPKLVEEAIDFAKQEGIEAPTVGSTATSGVLQGQYAQSVRVDPATQAKAMARPIAARKALLDQAEKRGFDGVAPEVLENILDTERTEINSLLKMTASKKIELNEAGDILDSLFSNWEQATEGHFALRYKDYFTKYGDDMSFDTSAAKKAAKEEIDGILAQGSDGGSIRTSLAPEGRLGNLIGRVYKLADNINTYTAPNGNTYQALEVVKQLRSDFGRLTQSQDPIERHVAGKMYKSLNDVFDTGIVNVADPALNAKAVADWKKLSSDWKSKLALEEVAPIAKLGRMDTTQIADWSKTVLAPGKYNTVKYLSDIMGPDGQQTLKDMFFTRVVSGERSPKGWTDTVNSTFKRFTDVNDTKTLDFLMTPKDRELLQRWASARDTLEGGLVNKIYNQNRAVASNAIELATTGSEQELKNAITLGGGIDSPFGQSVQAGFMQHLVDTATRSVHLHGDILSPNELAQQIAIMKERGTFQVIFPSKESQKWFDGYMAYQNVVGSLPGQAAGLQTGAMAGKALKSIIEIPELIAKDGPVSALARVYEVGTMGIPHRLLGTYLSREATKKASGASMEAAAKSKVAGGLRIAGNSVAGIRSGTIFMNSVIGQQKSNDLQEYDADYVNKTYNAGGM